MVQVQAPERPVIFIQTETDQLLGGPGVIIDLPQDQVVQRRF